MRRQPPPEPTADVADPEDRAGTGERLQKVLASAGSAAGARCEELIADGRVTVNGEVAVLGRRVEPEPTASRSTACRSASGPASSTTC